MELGGRPDSLPGDEDDGQGNPMTSETLATEKIRRYHLSSVRKMGRRSPSTSPSLQRRRMRKKDHAVEKNGSLLDFL